MLTKAYTKRLEDKRAPNSNYEQGIKYKQTVVLNNLLYICINPISTKVKYLSISFNGTLDSKQ
jgi:hypothetical protein